MTDIALLPCCPFCGGETERHTITEADEVANIGGDVICTKCGASAHVEFGGKANWLNCWNRRSSPSQVAPQPQAGEAVAWESPGEWELEQRAFHGANNQDAPEWARTLIADLWKQYCAAASPQPANPAQVTDKRAAWIAEANALVEEANDFAERMTSQPWACELIEKLLDTLTAAIGAGGQAVACKECDGTGFKDKNGARLTLARTPCGACAGSGYAAALSQPHPADERVVEEPTGFIDRHRQKFASVEKHDADFLLKSGWTPVYTHPHPQPHPADERVVEALREAKNLLWRLQTVIEVDIDRNVRKRIADFDAFVDTLSAKEGL